jgi:DNA-binding beta-propeller fold protein YncE
MQLPVASKTRKNRFLLRTAALLALILLTACGFNLNPNSLQVNTVPLPGIASNLKIENMIYDEQLQRVLAPTGPAGRLLMIDPQTEDITSIQGFGPQSNVVAVASGRNMLFVADRGSKQLFSVDPASRKILSSTALSGAPESVAFIPNTGEIWVVEPDQKKIETFTSTGTDPPKLEKSQNAQDFTFPSSPSRLVIDQENNVAYTNLPEEGKTIRLLMFPHSVQKEIVNGCTETRGMALDKEHKILFVACKEGRLVVLNVDIGAANDGVQIASQNYGGDVNDVGYNPRLKHVYLTSGASALLAVFEILNSNEAKAKLSITPTPQSLLADIELRLRIKATPTPAPTPTPFPDINLNRVRTADTSLQANCMTVDSLDNVWICDPGQAQLFVIHDPSN